MHDNLNQVKDYNQRNGIQYHDKIVRAIANILSLWMKAFAKLFKFLLIGLNYLLAVPINESIKEVKLK